MTNIFADAPDVDDDDEFNISVLLLSRAITEFGARSLWVELKRGYPQQFNEMLYYALDQLKK